MMPNPRTTVECLEYFEGLSGVTLELRTNNRSTRHFSKDDEYSWVIFFPDVIISPRGRTYKHQDEAARDAVNWAETHLKKEDSP